MWELRVWRAARDDFRQQELVQLPGRPFVAPSYGLGVMIDPQNALGRVVGHTGQGPGSTAAVYSFLDLKRPRTLAFTADDRAKAQGALETHLLVSCP